MTTISLPANYGWVILASAAIGFQCFATGFFFMNKRKKYFNKEFMEKNFKEVHEKEVGKFSLPTGGYPDQGNGRYSDKLSYGEWYDFNNAQRVHQNFVENVGVVVPATLIAGLAFPQAAAIAGGVHFLGRFLYAWGYTTKEGGNRRETGAVLAHTSTMLNLALSIVAAVRIIKGI